MGYFNFENGKTPINDTNLNHVQDLIEAEIQKVSANLKEKTQKNIMTRKFLRQGVTVNQSWGTGKIAFSSFNSIGDKVMSDLNGIRIGSGVSKVLVSAQCAGIGTNTVAGDKQLIIKKGTETIGNSYLGGGVSVNFINLCISPILLDVEENDVISLEVASGSTGTFEILAGQLTVEAVE